MDESEEVLGTVAVLFVRDIWCDEGLKVEGGIGMYWGIILLEEKRSKRREVSDAEGLKTWVMYGCV